MAIEDRRFYEHKGVDFEGIVRAAVKNLESKKDIQGGSTLTMQLVRNLYTGERARNGVAGYKRKIREAKLAQELENRHPGRPGKRWILNKYLNSVPYGTVGGQTAVGIQAAARIFFDKPASRADAAPRPRCWPGCRRRRRTTTRSSTRAPPPRGATRCCSGWPTRATSPRPRPTRRRRCSLGVKHNRYYTRQARGLLLRLRQAVADRRATASTPCAAAACASTRRSTSTCRSSRAQGDGRQPRRPATAPRRIVSIDPRNGYIRAMASSSRYGDSKFNLAAQGHRQAGSTFKVMVLMDALRRGVDPNTHDATSRSPLQLGWLPTAPTTRSRPIGTPTAAR